MNCETIHLPAAAPGSASSSSAVAGPRPAAALAAALASVAHFNFDSKTKRLCTDTARLQPGGSTCPASPGD